MEKDHGRLETRGCWVLSELEDFAPRGLWKGLGSLVAVRSQREDLNTGKVSGEVRYFISSLGRAGSAPATAERQPCLCMT